LQRGPVFVNWRGDVARHSMLVTHREAREDV